MRLNEFGFGNFRVSTTVFTFWFWGRNLRFRKLEVRFRKKDFLSAQILDWLSKFLGMLGSTTIYF